MAGKNNELMNQSFSDEIDTVLLKNHIHFLTGDIVESNVLEAIKWITYENLLPGNDPLVLFINSDGGNLQDAFALIEVMRHSQKVIKTIGIGSICSSAFLIFAAGTKGERYITKTASIMCHQFSDGYTGKYHDIKSAAKENEQLNQRMVSLLKDFTDFDVRTIKSKLLPPSDVWFTAEELVELGIADNIF
jgi:ATP-dependent Clp protease protease subunit